MSGIIVRHNLSFDYLQEVSAAELCTVDLTGQHPATGYEYEICFYAADELCLSLLAITTEKRQSFLKKGAEEQAHTALVDLSNHVRQSSGGIFRIHPSYGAVYGTKINPVAPDFYLDTPRLDESLSVSIKLSDEGYEFDDEPLHPTPNPRTTRPIHYLSTPKRNPNQTERDQAIGHGLGERWDAEFLRYNGPPDHSTLDMRPSAMEVTPHNIIRLVHHLGDQALLTAVTIAHLRTKYRDPAYPPKRGP